MGLIGRYIEALTDTQRDRIIEATDFNDALYHGFFHDGCGCLVAVAEMEHEYDSCPVNLSMESHRRCGPFPGNHFPVLCDRFGKDRIVRLCKSRAAKGNAPAERTVFLYGSSLLANDGFLGGAQPQGRRPFTWVGATEEVVKP